MRIGREIDDPDAEIGAGVLRAGAVDPGRFEFVRDDAVYARSSTWSVRALAPE